MLRRAFLAFCVLAALAPIGVAAHMVSQVPPSALIVPRVQLAGAGVALTPAALGAQRDAGGLRVDAQRLNATLAEVAKSTAAAPQAASYVLTTQGVVLNQGAPGRALDTAKAREMLMAALRDPPDSELQLPMTQVAPPPPPQFAIIVRLSELRLDVYEGTAHRKRYPVGVGALRFPTPPGVYHIKSKAKNPTWNNPNSSWSRGMPSHIGPGPKNPLGSRAMRLDRQALVIHGTPDQSSVGRRSSHGCMRMRKADVEELYDTVPTGTPVFIIP